MAMPADAPLYSIPARRVVAVEHPMVVKNVDNAIKSFGNVPLQDLLDSDNYESSLPVFLRQNDPSAAPVLSHNMPSTNLVLKIRVPRRTGRKRKRGSFDPFRAQDATEDVSNVKQTTQGTDRLLSQSRQDDPHVLLRSLNDNAGSYKVEVIGAIDQTHRYRGLADFHVSTSNGRFMKQFREKLLPMDLEKMKEFSFDPSRGPRPNDEILPPPRLTDQPLAFNWGYHQNPAIKFRADNVTGVPELINQYAPVKVLTRRLDCDDPMPPYPTMAPPDEPIMQSLVAELQRVLEERPIWTRRGITNQVKGFPGVYLMKPALQYVTYQFRGGPWRDALIKFGVDPRTDPKYRQYQTLFFKLFQGQDREVGAAWEDPRSEYTRQINKPSDSRDSHIFDGKSVTLDGKVWQVCDITDPLLQRLLSTDLLRSECDTASDGWYHNGTWAKVKAIMRTKLTAIRAGVKLPEDHFDDLLESPDIVPGKTRVNLNAQPVPGVTPYYHKRRPHKDTLGKPTPRNKPTKRGKRSAGRQSTSTSLTSPAAGSRASRAARAKGFAQGLQVVAVDPSLMAQSEQEVDDLDDDELAETQEAAVVFSEDDAEDDDAEEDSAPESGADEEEEEES